MARIELKQPLIQAQVQVARSDIHRFGVFATQDFAKGELIEECPVLRFETTWPAVLKDYVFKLEGETFLALGNASVYNHATEEASAHYQYFPEEEVLRLVAAKPIAAGDEIYINYGNEWFSDRGKEVTTPEQATTETRSSGRLSHMMEFLIFAAVVAVVIKLQFFN